MNAPGWTRLPSFAACCRRLKDLSRSEQRGPVSTVSHSLLAPEIESRELCNSWRTRMSGRRDVSCPSIREPSKTRVFWFSLQQLRRKEITIAHPSNSCSLKISGPRALACAICAAKEAHSCCHLPSGLTCQSEMNLYVTVGSKGLGGSAHAHSSYALVQHIDYESFWINIQRPEKDPARVLLIWVWDP